MSADHISTPSIIYPFPLIFSFTLSFVSFLTEIATSHTFATQLVYPQTQIRKAEAAFYTTRKVLRVCKGLSQDFFIDYLTLDTSCENDDSRYC